MRQSYRVSPHTSTADHVTTCGVPLNVGNTVVLVGLHQLKVGGQILLSLILLALEVHVPEVKIEVGLRVDSGNNHETTLRGPVDTVAGLLLNGADELEVARCVALLLGGEERDSSLGKDCSTGGGLAVCDDDETRPIRLPGEVDDGILQAIHNLDWHTLLTNTEDLQVGSHRLLRLGVTVDLDAHVRTLGLPVQLDVRNVEEVTGAHNLLGGNAHHGDTGRVAANLRCPEAKKLFILLHTFTGHGSR